MVVQKDRIYDRRRVEREISDKLWLVGQAVKTPASHAGNGGSIPPRVILNREIEKPDMFELR